MLLLFVDYRISFRLSSVIRGGKEYMWSIQSVKKRISAVLHSAIPLHGNRFSRNKEAQYSIGTPGMLLTAGAIEHLDYSQPLLSISGRMFHPDLQIEEFRINIDGMPIGKNVMPVPRDDIPLAFPFFPTARLSGFCFCCEVPPEVLDRWADIEIMGLSRNSVLARLSAIFPPGFNSSQFPVPPATLMERVALIQDPRAFWCQGLTCFSEFFEVMQEYCDFKRMRRFLDWGCGCGRVTAIFLKYLNAPEIHGCDVDKEAIDGLLPFSERKPSWHSVLGESQK